jgi:hypothetical protein
MKLFYKIKRKIRKWRFSWFLFNIQKRIFEDIINLRLESMMKTDKDMSAELIVMSKDRAMQLHTLLATKKELVKNCNAVTVLFTTSTVAHSKSYDELKSEFPDVKFIRESDFKSDILQILQHSANSKFAFFCDDGFFKEPVDFHQITRYNPFLFCFSMNRGLDTTNNIGVVYDLPEFLDGIVTDENVLCWKWKDAVKSPDWAYPLSVGGVFFSRLEMLSLLKMIDFKGPNSLEGHLQKFINIYKSRFGLCFKSAPMGSIPANIVSSESHCSATNIYSADDLLKKWEEGYIIDYKRFYNRSWDELLYEKFEFIKR